MGRFHVITLGCPKNRVDSEHLAGICVRAGLIPSEDPEEADLLVLNTCAFIAPAVEESLEKLNEVLDWKHRGKGRRVVLAGCLPGRYPDDGSEGLEEIDLLIGPRGVGRFARWLGVPWNGRSLAGSGTFRYVKLAEGCDNRCAYCTIPLIRGRFTPRSAGSVLESVGRVVRQGAREVGFVAQDSGAHPELQTILDKATGRYPRVWFRLYYLHPAHFPSWLPSFFQDRENLAPYADLPIQHAAPGILDRMGRGYGPERLQGILDSLESLRRPVAVRFTVITGYPGESDADFRALENFLAGCPSLRHLAAFRWWPEEGTREYARVALSRDAVPEGTASGRLGALASLGEAVYHAWNLRLSREPFQVMADTPETGHGQYDAPEADPEYRFSRAVEPGRVYRCILKDEGSGGPVVEPVP